MFVRIVRGPGLINAISEITIGLTEPRVRRIKKLKNSLGSEVMTAYVLERFSEAPRTADSFFDLFEFIPCVLFANAALNHSAYATPPPPLILFILGLSFASLLYTTLQLN